MNDEIKREVLNKVLSTDDWIYIGKDKYRFNNVVIHARFCSNNIRAPYKYKFNINPNTLRANYELWICGSPEIYYLLPNSIICEFYNSPNAYVDKRHPEIKIV